MKQTLIFALSIILIASCTETKNYEIAYQITEQDIIPEGITYSEKTGNFYVSSILKSKILQVNSKTGELEDYIPSGLIDRSFVGMMVDDKRNYLYACGHRRTGDIIVSSVFKFNLNSHELIKEYPFPTALNQLANDVAIDINGNVYFTDSNNKHIYKINTETDSVELFFESEEIGNPNGITLSPDNKYLYVAAYEKGVRVIDVETKEILNGINEMDSKGIDGLKFYNNSVIGIQNYYDDLNEIRIIKLNLDGTLTSITSSEIIDKGNPNFDIPTTHVIVNDELFCLATSSLGNVDWEKFEIKDLAKLSNVKILKYKLNK